MWIKTSDKLPKTLQHVLVAGINEYGNKVILRAYYAPKFTVEDNDFNGAEEYCEENDTYYIKEGFYESNNYDEVNWNIDFVTHWMELPEYPID